MRKGKIGLLVIIISIIIFLYYVLLKLAFQWYLCSSPLTLLSLIIEIITLLILLIAPLSIGKLLTIIDITTHKGIGTITVIFLWIEILSIFGNILIIISLINIFYASLKIMFFAINPINETWSIMSWAVLLIFGLIVRLIAKKLKKKI